jgi:hypothetical protein
MLSLLRNRSVMVAHLFLLPIDGCSINPSRSFGPSLVAAMAGIEGDYYPQQYMFWFAPVIGATVAAILYEYAPLKPKKRANKDDMGVSLYVSDQRREVEDDEEEEEGEEDDKNKSKYAAPAEDDYGYKEDL